MRRFSEQYVYECKAVTSTITTTTATTVATHERCRTLTVNSVDISD